MGSTSLRVALVGRRLADNDNLGLAYLVSALGNESVERWTLNQVTDIAPIAREIARRNPVVVGLSIVDGGSAFLPLALGEMLSNKGYAGHITAGGQFATLARTWLLDRYAWLSSVVRFDGELPLQQLVSVLQGKGYLHSVQGLTTRAGDGLPASLMDQQWLSIRPCRDKPPQILGHGVAHILASRGCAGRCSYCAPAALADLAVDECKRANMTARTALNAGVGGVRWRPVEAICDEMASLFHQQGVRYFFFADEHMLPYAPPAALEFLGQLKAGLASRKVGRVGIGCMLRAERLTPAIVRAFVDVGLIRAFIGVEFTTKAEGLSFRRHVVPDHALTILSELHRLGVAAMSNMMLVHPDSTIDSIAAGIRFMQSDPHTVFEVARMMVYHGTRLHDRMAKEGRLQGNPLRYGYSFADPVVDRFADLVLHLRASAFHNHSLGYRTHDAFVSLALARRLEVSAATSDIERDLAALKTKVHALYVDTYKHALELAIAGRSQDFSPFIGQTARKSKILGAMLERAEARLIASFGPTGVFSPFRKVTSTTMHLVMASMLAGCGTNGTSHITPTDSRAADIADSAADFAITDVGDVASDFATTCPTPDVVLAALAAQDPCFSGEFTYDNNGPVLWPSDAGLSQTQLSQFCSSPPTILNTYEQTASQVLAGIDAGPDSETTCSPGYTSISGGVTSQVNQIENTIYDCTDAGVSYVQVVIDATGAVTDVVANPNVDAGADAGALDPTTVSCIKTALAGLTFSCLQSVSVCGYVPMIEPIVFD